MASTGSHPVSDDTTGVAPNVVPIGESRAHCAYCGMRELCLPAGFATTEIEDLHRILGKRVKLRRGEALYRAGAPFTALYAVRIGSLKTVTLSDDGREQVTGYRMPGDLVGLDGMGTRRHESAASALEDSECCVIPVEHLETMERLLPALQHGLHRILGQEISADHGMMLLLGSMHAEERLAAFLLDLSARYRARGYSAREFVLRMTREEIGSYLGLKLETVSRLLSKFHEGGLVQVQGRRIKIIDMPRLRQLVNRRT
ncbi:MAG: fumarate/nitrate reduction transcriptional regulator Fnr [Burkholderiaceae bacterium]|jgi:CRP/FNR family transcriptional regulator|nr:fumarate/nitrate reduction transcriptional regulator Fnr [Burkholderiaceae bacterium]